MGLRFVAVWICVKSKVLGYRDGIVEAVALRHPGPCFFIVLFFIVVCFLCFHLARVWVEIWGEGGSWGEGWGGGGGGLLVCAERELRSSFGVGWVGGGGIVGF